ncbi:MAG: bifunctional glutamate N-acetyltransferase/amino-acid acetyltransferase ArgJ [Treponema sp.]|jgi:glutamate N-acetyltransferase/amino-acid N-acetyltransferase|nr:bifunctional glutamate N-acetyltransferase/amino-acid acetyltransferase ArgJ [Treponema sp.]
MKEITGGICAPRGFLAGGIRCGIKPTSQKKDLAIICSLTPCTAAAMFTTNKVKAACVQVSQENIKDGKVRAVIVNSGNANACTGPQGLAAAKKMAEAAAGILQIDPSEVVVASTGVIGVPLPVNLIEKNIDTLKAELRDDVLGHEAALEAIMTTDIRKKEIAVEIELGGKTVRIGVMAKGSGMIHPNMEAAKQATMLAFATTDAAITVDALEACLQNAVKKSFNRVTVDGDTSTNDMIVVLANGKAENPIINSEQTAAYEVFSAALEFVCVTLARMVARDGEGATKLITVTVAGADCEQAAEALAMSVASSSLVKAACFGADANWGRVLCAMGYAGVDFFPDEASVVFKSRAGLVQVCKDGVTVPFDEKKAKEVLSEEEIEILIDLKGTSACISVWGCDLTYDYVKINGDYRS